MNNITWIDIATLVLAIVGGIFALFQWSNSNRIRRVEFVDQILNKLRFEKKLVQAMYIIEYKDEWYNENFHNNSDFEPKVDALLSYLSYVCYLKNMRIIKEKEFSAFKYQLNRTCQSSSVEEYLWNLKHFSKKNNTNSSFEELEIYGKRQKIFSDEFNNEVSANYSQYLNF